MRAWLGVVSADHVQQGTSLGIAQIGHGKKDGLARMSAGDIFVYYSPRDTLGGVPLQEFTAIGQVADDEMWQAEEGQFKPWRRRIDYDTSARHVPLQEVRADLELAAGPNWGHQLRRGLVPLSHHDAEVLAAAMGARP